ncbi:hypothetical protein [Bosea sp. OK403]|uniref:hypothetical protein n=1 Tax=Bosea sp. OK403 TaxID=1855286 RepID=UPI001587917B|nr:hypothetical protein [Bosea sp. OK403]
MSTPSNIGSDDETLNRSYHPAADLEASTAAGDDSAAGDWERIATQMEAPLATSENPARQDRDGERSQTGLPAVQHSAFAKHWLAVDEGGAELMTATFGAPARQALRRVAPVSISHDRPAIQPVLQTRSIAPPPTRLRATVVLFLLALTILLAEPATRLFVRAVTVRAEARWPGHDLRPGAGCEKAGTGFSHRSCSHSWIRDG